MRIKKGVFTDYGEFELDTAAIVMRSNDRKNIRLPYTGKLPGQMPPASDSYIYLNVQLSQEAHMVLIVDNGFGKVEKRPLEAASEEIIELLDKFFAQGHADTGLESYWLGIWQAHYIEWRNVVTCPCRLLSVTPTLSEKDRLFLHKHMMEAGTAV